MDHTFAIYQLQTEMWRLLYEDWKAGLMTAEYWGIVLFILLYYALWWKLTDKRRITELLLFGSLVAVMREIVDLAGVTSGLWLYKVRILPLASSVFLHNLTITPLTYMLALQYSPNWRQFFWWGAVAAGFIHFVLFPILSWAGIFQAMNWNYVYGFLVSYGVGILSRAAFHLVKQVQNKAVKGYDHPMKSTLIQPAFKPLRDEEPEP